MISRTHVVANACGLLIFCLAQAVLNFEKNTHLIARSIGGRVVWLAMQIVDTWTTRVIINFSKSDRQRERETESLIECVPVQLLTGYTSRKIHKVAIVEYSHEDTTPHACFKINGNSKKPRARKSPVGFVQFPNTFNHYLHSLFVCITDKFSIVHITHPSAYYQCPSIVRKKYVFSWIIFVSSLQSTTDSGWLSLFSQICPM